MLQLRVPRPSPRLSSVVTAPLVAIALLFAIATPTTRSASAQPIEGTVPIAVLSLTPPIQTQPIGASFTVDVQVANVDNLAAYDFTLTFDNTVLEYVSVADAGFLTSTGRRAMCASPEAFGGRTAEQNVNNDGAFNYHCNTYGMIVDATGTRGPDGAGVIAHVTFRAKAAGASGVNFVGTTGVASYHIHAANGNVDGDREVYGYTGLASVEDCSGNGCTPIVIGVASQGASVVVKAACLWDVNGSGRVDSLDLLLVALHFNAMTGSPRYDARYDLNHSGWINSLDLLIVARHFGNCP